LKRLFGLFEEALLFGVVARKKIAADPPKALASRWLPVQSKSGAVDGSRLSKIMVSCQSEASKMRVLSSPFSKRILN
jgi:hypothetical protein